MLQRINEQEQSLQSAAVMHDQVSGLIGEGILVPDANGNLDLNTGDERFEQVIQEKIKTSKQKAQNANASLN